MSLFEIFHSSSLLYIRHPRTLPVLWSPTSFFMSLNFAFHFFPSNYKINESVVNLRFQVICYSSSTLRRVFDPSTGPDNHPIFSNRKLFLGLDGHFNFDSAFFTFAFNEEQVLLIFTRATTNRFHSSLLVRSAESFFDEILSPPLRRSKSPLISSTLRRTLPINASRIGRP
jgi:hypothetical protein